MRSHNKKRQAPSAPSMQEGEAEAVARGAKATSSGARCCVECGATSTPQWREGPMGPKTLCNACGVRRQRQIRRAQQAANEAQQAVALQALQARKRLADLTHQAQALLEECASGDSSDETELSWGGNAAGGSSRSHHEPTAHHDAPEQDRPHGAASSAGCSEDSEEHSAACDLLFFAGIDYAQTSHGGTHTPQLAAEPSAPSEVPAPASRPRRSRPEAFTAKRRRTALPMAAPAMPSTSVSSTEGERGEALAGVALRKPPTALPSVRSTSSSPATLTRMAPLELVKEELLPPSQQLQLQPQAHLQALPAQLSVLPAHSEVLAQYAKHIAMLAAYPLHI